MLVSDREMAEVLLMGVTLTHRDEVRHFPHTDTQLSFQAVLSTVKAESEIDELLKKEEGSVMDMGNAKNGSQSGNKSRGKTKRKRGTCIYCNRRASPTEKATTINKWKKASDEEEDEEEPRDIGIVATMVDSADEGCTRFLEWVLDSGSTTHAGSWRPPEIRYLDFAAPVVPLLGFEKQNGFYRVTTPVQLQEETCVSLMSVATEVRVQEEKQGLLWHRRFAHLNFEALRRIQRNHAVDGLSKATMKGTVTCMVCTVGKTRQMSYRRTVTCGGRRYFQLVQDEFSRYNFPMQDTPISVSHQIKEQNLLKALARSMWTNAYTPEDNNIVEKSNGVVLSKVRTLLLTVNLPDALWGEAFVIDVKNIAYVFGAAQCTSKLKPLRRGFLLVTPPKLRDIGFSI
ncbi:TPA: LOW QUALITY PROTEIN: hypothetical protein N0F65_012977 [Lagenidium giganteum]|uniref:GAG-pre-integrase domain-containing protein n=1 Tax=Lagenidium giganteum TaxID=4803 RepID=A0AAV2YZI8_9STRA|nr:TPA: LOW QUALITY PROTEIN: hypothetical protein N0F65_012977 [Lagenidium giganteum]